MIKNFWKMDLIGDSFDISGDLEKCRCAKAQLDQNLNEFKALLLCEEKRMYQLENHRLKLEQEINCLSEEINEERLLYKKTIENLLEEREKVSSKYLENFDQQLLTNKTLNVEGSASVNQLIKSSKDALKSMSDCLKKELNFDTNSVRGEIMASMKINKKKSKEEYMISMRDFLKKKIN